MASKKLMSFTSTSHRITALALALVGVTVFSAGCAHRGPKAGGGAVGAVIRESEGASPAKYSAAESAKNLESSPFKVYEIKGVRLRNTTFDYPVMVNQKVEQWIGYFTGKGRKYFDKYLERGRYFIPEIAKTLKEHNMPQDLVYLAMIESGFNNTAKSRAKAVGPWQFMKFTGKRFGLRTDYWVDERRDTRRATQAAIAYLSELYEEFGSWELAAAGYNAGENKVRRAIKKYKTHDFWQIARNRFFRPETRDYVPKIMAAAILTKNPELFGFDDPFGRGKTGKVVNNPTVDPSLADSEVTPKELGEPDEKAVDDPEDNVAAVKAVEAAAEAEEELADEDYGDDAHATLSSDPTAVMTPSVYLVANPHEQIVEFEVRGPADLFAVSKASGLPFSTVKLLNPELLRWCTPPDLKTYRVKLPQSVKGRFLATYNDPSFDRRVVFLPYKIKHGDNLKTIAKRYKVYETDPIREINASNLNALHSMRAGAEILLPVPTGYKRVIASMYDEKPSPPRSRRRARARSARRSRKHSVGAATTRSNEVKPSKWTQRERLKPRVGGA